MHHKLAAMFIGDKGVGKSTLLSLLGGAVGVEFLFNKVETNEALESQVRINGQQVMLMGDPGLYGTENGVTDIHIKKLTGVLSQGYDYKLFFVVSGENFEFSANELALMSEVNGAIHDAIGAKVELWVVVNRIQNERIYNKYKEDMTQGLQKYLDHSAKSSNLSLDIPIKGVILFRNDANAVRNKGFYHQLAGAITPSSTRTEHVIISTRARPESPSLRYCTTVFGGSVLIAAAFAPLGAAIAGVAAGGYAVAALASFLTFSQMKERRCKK